MNKYAILHIPTGKYVYRSCVISMDSWDLTPAYFLTDRIATFNGYIWSIFRYLSVRKENKVYIDTGFKDIKIETSKNEFLLIKVK